MTPLATGPSPTEHDLAPERTIATARVLAALPEQVYAAFSSSERLARWWGPKGFRNTFQVFEPRPGGTCAPGMGATPRSKKGSRR